MIIQFHVNDVFVERVRNKSIEKIRDPDGIRTQDLLNTSQTILPLSHMTSSFSGKAYAMSDQYTSNDVPTVAVCKKS